MFSRDRAPKGHNKREKNNERRLFFFWSVQNISTSIPDTDNDNDPFLSALSRRVQLSKAECRGMATRVGAFNIGNCRKTRRGESRAKVAREGV